MQWIGTKITDYVCAIAALKNVVALTICIKRTSLLDREKKWIDMAGPACQKMIWTKINSNLIHMFAPQLICPSTKLPFRQLSAVWCKGNFTDEKATFAFILQVFSIP